MKKAFETLLTFIILAATDIFGIVLAFALSIFVRDLIGNFVKLPVLESSHFEVYLHSNWWIIPLYLVIFASEGLYSKHRPFWQEVKSLTKAIALSALLVYSSISLGRIDEFFSRVLFVLHPLLLLVIAPLLRRIVKALMYRVGYWRKRILEIRIDTDYSLKFSFIRNKFIGYWVVASTHFSLKKDSLAQIVEKVKQLTATNQTETISIIVKDFANPQISELVERLYFVSGHVLLVPELMDLDMLNADVYHMMYENLFVFDINKGLNSPANRLIKRLIDFVLSLIGIIVFSPILLAESLLIFIKDGFPIFYNHDRYGKGGNIFTFHKFRSMKNESYHNQNDDRLWDYLNANPEIKEKEWDRYQKLENDPRILPGMNIIRRTSLDELAQLFNVLKGEMSIVGPRPFMPRERELIGDYFDRVLAAKPGITDLWTVSGRDALSFDQRLRMSTWYIQNWSLWLDFVIIVKTIQQVILYFVKWSIKSKKQSQST